MMTVAIKGGLIALVLVIVVLGATYILKFSPTGEDYTDIISLDASLDRSVTFPEETINPPAVSYAWETYISQKLGISIRYPAAWILNTPCEKYNALFLGYSAETAGNCGISELRIGKGEFRTDFAWGLVIFENKEDVFTEAKDEWLNDPELKETFDNAEELTVNGRRAVKLSGVIRGSKNPLLPNGTIYISYIIEKPDGTVLHAGYAQKPGWEDQTEIFETIVGSITFL